MPTQSVLSKLSQRILESWPIEKWKSNKTILAVSGGPDSVAMLRLLDSIFTQHAPNNRLVVVHVDHGIRQDSKDDAAFVKDLAERFGCEYHAFELDLGQGNDELSLRKSRYQVLNETAVEIGARYIATGHNKDDQIETILFRAVRGTGIDGLAGIPFVRALNEDVAIVRPLLDFHRCEIIELLNELGQNYRVDSSNQESNYSRNFMRNEIIPLIKQQFGATFPKSILNLGQQAAENHQLLNELAVTLDPFIKTDLDSIELNCDELRKFPVGLVRHAIRRAWSQTGWPQRDMSMDHWQRVSEFVVSKKNQSPITLPGNIRVQRSGTTTFLSR